MNPGTPGGIGSVLDSISGPDQDQTRPPAPPQAPGQLPPPAPKQAGGISGLLDDVSSAPPPGAGVNANNAVGGGAGGAFAQNSTSRFMEDLGTNVKSGWKSLTALPDWQKPSWLGGSAGPHTEEAGPVKDLLNSVHEAVQGVRSWLKDPTKVGEDTGRAIGYNMDEIKRREQANDTQGVWTQILADTVPILFTLGLGELGRVGLGGEEAVGATRERPGLGPVEAQTQRATEAAAKTGIPAGEPERVIPGGRPAGPVGPTATDLEGMQQTIHTDLHQGIKQTFAKAASDAGVQPARATDVTRNVASDMRQQIWDRSSQAFKELDAASGGRWQRFNTAIGNLERLAEEKIGIDNEAAAKAQEEIDRISDERDQLVDQLVKEGQIKPGMAAQANADWAQQKDLLKVDKVIKSNTRLTATGQEEITNPQALEKGLQTLYDEPAGKSRFSGEVLQRAMGSEENAKQLLNHVRTAHDALDSVTQMNQEFKMADVGESTIRATGLQRLREMIQSATSSKGGAVRGAKGITDWNKVSDAFSKMDPGERALAFGGRDAQSLVQKFISDQVRFQTRRAMTGKLMTRTGATGIGLEVLGKAGIASGAAKTALDAAIVGGSMPVAALGNIGRPAAPQAAPRAAPQPQAKAQAPGTATATPIWEAFPDDEKLADHVIDMEGDSAIAKRNNNPGNLKSPSGGFQKFATEKEGRAALVRQIARWRAEHPDWTVADFNRNYAPDKSHGGDNPEGTEEGRNRRLLRMVGG